MILKFNLFIVLLSFSLCLFCVPDSFAVSKSKQSESSFVRCLEEFQWDERIPVGSILKRRAMKGKTPFDKNFRFQTRVSIGVKVFENDWNNLGEEANRLIFENPDYANLAPGTYNYVYTVDEELRFGRVEDLLAYGVEQVHIAKAKEVLIAGEIVIDTSPHERVLYNVRSASYSEELRKEYSSEYVNRLKKCIRPVFYEFFKNNKEIIEVTDDQSLLISRWSKKRLAKLCSNNLIFYFNMGTLCEYFKGQKVANN